MSATERIAVTFDGASLVRPVEREVARAVKGLGGRVVAPQEDFDLAVTQYPRTALEAVKSGRRAIYLPLSWNLGGSYRHPVRDAPEILRWLLKKPPLDCSYLGAHPRYGPLLRALEEGDPRAHHSRAVDRLFAELLSQYDRVSEDRRVRRLRSSVVATEDRSVLTGEKIAIVSHRPEDLAAGYCQLQQKNDVTLFQSYRSAAVALRERDFDWVLSESTMPWEPPCLPDLSEVDRPWRPLGEPTEVVTVLLGAVRPNAFTNVLFYSEVGEVLTESAASPFCVDATPNYSVYREEVDRETGEPVRRRDWLSGLARFV